MLVDANKAKNKPSFISPLEEKKNNLHFSPNFETIPIQNHGLSGM